MLLEANADIKIKDNVSLFRTPCFVTILPRTFVKADCDYEYYFTIYTTDTFTTGDATNYHTTNCYYD